MFAEYSPLWDASVTTWKISVIRTEPVDDDDDDEEDDEDEEEEDEE